jgi:hypothetical protein
MQPQSNLSIYGSKVPIKNMDIGQQKAFGDEPYPHLGSIVSWYNKQNRTSIKVFFQYFESSGTSIQFVGRAWEDMEPLETREEFEESVKKFLVKFLELDPSDIGPIRNLESDGF